MTHGPSSTSYKLSYKSFSLKLDISYSPKGVLEIIDFLIV